jgi:hypothetical protein
MILSSRARTWTADANDEILILRNADAAFHGSEYQREMQMRSEILEHGMGFEPMCNGFAGRRVSHFATRAHLN